MTNKKVQGVLRIEFLDNYPTQVLLANYLRGTGDAKGHVLSAAIAYFYPIALAKTKGISRQDKQMALLDALRGLDNQKKYLIDYYHIHEGIEIAHDPLVNAGSPATMPSSSTPQTIEDDDDDDDDDAPVCLTFANDNVSLNF
jgi:hypothetical protein